MSSATYTRRTFRDHELVSHEELRVQGEPDFAFAALSAMQMQTPQTLLLDLSVAVMPEETTEPETAA